MRSVVGAALRVRGELVDGRHRPPPPGSAETDLGPGEVVEGGDLPVAFFFEDPEPLDAGGVLVWSTVRELVPAVADRAIHFRGLEPLPLGNRPNRPNRPTAGARSLGEASRLGLLGLLGLVLGAKDGLGTHVKHVGTGGVQGL
jgi:hypothetical protein